MNALLLYLSLLAVARDTLPPQFDLEIDKRRFPCRAICSSAMKMQDEYLEWLRNHQLWDDRYWWEYQSAIDQTETLQDIWRMCHRAQEEFFWQAAYTGHDFDPEYPEWFASWRKSEFGRLRIMIGESRYWSGQMPDPLPVRYLYRLRGR